MDVIDIASAPSAGDTNTAVPFAGCWISPEAVSGAVRVLESGWVTTGREVQAFEAEFAAAVGAQHAVAMSSCTAALELALRSLDLPPGAPVLASTLTFCGAVQAIVHAGLTPVLLDVDQLTGMPTPRAAREAARAHGAAALMVVHWAGDLADVDALAEAAGVPPTHVVIDAAHAVGSTYAGQPVGGGAAVCFSFYATKNLPIGEGGMVTTDDAAKADWLRRARLHGMSADAWRRYLPGGSWRYDVLEAGLKANMSDVQAAIGRAQLTYLDDWQRRRAELARHYDERLAGLPGIGLPHRPDRLDRAHAWHLYPIRVTPESGTTRDELLACLARQDIGTSVHFIPVHRLTHFGRLCLTPPEGFPGADALFEQLLSLPLHPRLSDRQVDTVCRAVAGATTSTPEAVS